MTPVIGSIASERDLPSKGHNGGEQARAWRLKRSRAANGPKKPEPRSAELQPRGSRSGAASASVSVLAHYSQSGGQGCSRRQETVKATLNHDFGTGGRPPTLVYAVVIRQSWGSSFPRARTLVCDRVTEKPG
jgi:hypothetical protein